MADLTPITHLEKSIAGETTPVTHLEKVIAGEISPVTHLEKVIAQQSGGGEITYEDSETIYVDVGADLTAFFTFAENHPISDGWRIDIIGANGVYALVQCATRAGSLQKKTYFKCADDYQYKSPNGSLSYCSFNDNTCIVSAVGDENKIGNVKLRAYKIY